LKCGYCGIWKTPRKEMGTIDAKRAITEFAGAGCVWWDFTGGEPLLRKDIGELVNHCKDHGLVVDIGRHGLLLKGKLPELKNLDYLVVSLDGPKKVNDKMRGDGTFDKVLEGIKAAIGESFDVIINAVVSDANTKNDFEGIRYLLQLSEELGCKISFSTMYGDSFNKGEIKDILPRNSMGSLRKMFKGRKNIVSVNGFFNSSFGSHNKRCKAGSYFIDIMPDGLVVPCLMRQDEGVPGLEVGFKNAFEKLRSKNDCSCRSTCYAQMNSLLSLNPKTVAEVISNYSRQVKVF
jgi:MoaA/NifB/PqqE/SkfB family radical SAM enzyme